ncbi:MAG: SRPBCC domain-containing protein [Chitinophagaceae bacterium]
MEKLHFSININAPKEKVWQTLWNDATYRKWTSAFGEGSHAKTDNWKEGSKVLFLGSEDSGMVSTVAANKPNEFMSFKHLGEIHNGVEDTTSDKVKAWAGSTENYTLKDTNGKTELLIDMDITEEFKDMFTKMWPNALKNVKELAETKAKPITVEAVVNAPVEKVWETWTKPEHIMQWCQASDDWHAPLAENDVKVGGKFKTVMAAKDGSFSFDFGGVYTAIKENEAMAYDMADGRQVSIQFKKNGANETKVIETFDPEDINPEEMQRGGWQAILNNFKKYTEGVK